MSFDQNNELPRDYDLEGACYPSEAHFRSPRTHGQGLVHKQRLHAQTLSVSPNNMPTQSDTLIVDVISDPAEDVDVGQTLKLSPSHLAQIQKHSTPNFQNDRLQDFVQRDITDQSNFLTLLMIELPLLWVIPIALMCSTYLSVRSAGSCLTLEVISGPSRGFRCSVNSTNPSRLPLTLGRVSPSDLLIKDSEVSGKHALIKWNLDVNPFCSLGLAIGFFKLYGVQ